MSAEKIEFVKPPVNSKREKKLVAFGSALVILGLLAAAQIPTQASGTLSNPRTATDPATVIWDGSASGVELQFNGNQLTFQRGHRVSLCEFNVYGTCDMPIFTQDLAAGLTSITFYSYQKYRNSGTTELGAGQYVGKVTYADTGTPGDLSTFSSTQVGNTFVLTLPLTQAPAGGQNNQQNQGTSAQTSRASAPPIQMEFSGATSASQLLAGNRNFTFEGSNMRDVMAVRVSGKSLPMFKRTDTSFQVRLPKLEPGSYSVTVYTETANWEVPDAIVIGEYIPEVRKEAIQESFEKASSELPKATKQEIRDIIEQTPNLRKVTVTAIAYREIVKENGNKLARARAASALEFINKLEPGVIIETKLVYRGDTDLSSRGLVFRVAQKKN